jgi:dolichyl-phosphate beta-glucosyltransferase
MDLSVVIPVYNAAGFVPARFTFLSRYLEGSSLDYEILAVDDGSTDGSADVLDGLDLPRCEVVRRTGNGGKFAAIATGVERARGRCILFTDADVPYDPGAIPHLSDLILRQGFHLAIGDRSLDQSTNDETTPLVRRIASAVFTGFIRLFVTGGLHDSQCGIKALRSDVARLLFGLMRERGFTGDVELLYLALKYNLAVRRVPVHLDYQGPTSVHVIRDGLAMAWSALRLRRRYRLGLYRSDALAALARQDYPSAHTSRAKAPAP